MLKVEIIGNIARNTISEENYSGRRVLKFSVCHNEGYKDAATGEWKETSSTWITCFKDISGRVNVPLEEQLKAAQKVFVRGNLRSRIVCDRSGQHTVGLSCSVYEVEILSRVAAAEGNK